MRVQLDSRAGDGVRLRRKRIEITVDGDGVLLNAASESITKAWCTPNRRAPVVFCCKFGEGL